MPPLSFKGITPVETGMDLVDTCLSYTQRHTPTVVHRRYDIRRVREFYMHKVKVCGQTFTEKLDRIVNDFPRVDSIHEFFADLINVIYDLNHYKLALGQISKCRSLIRSVGEDHVKQLKYADTDYRCKKLKIAAFGRMAKLVKKLDPSLKYLEQVRQHMSRLPAVDPNTRTLILTGMPSVGKSSFLNAVTRANVDVQPYAFTTQTLLVGHTEYNYAPWQIIDTPGLLDRPLEERNTIETQAITALAHLRATVLFVLDPSEQCDFTLDAQIALFRSIRVLFTNKPLFILLNKQDVWGQLTAEQQAKIDALRVLPDGREDTNMHVLPCSTATRDGVMDIRNKACQALLDMRVEAKLQTQSAGPGNIMDRLYVAKPAAPVAGRGLGRRGGSSTIPASVLAERERVSQMRSQGMEHEDVREQLKDEYFTQRGKLLEREVMQQNGGAGVYWDNPKKYRDLANPEEQFDDIPEILGDANIADWVNPEIDEMIARLDLEETQQLAEFELFKDRGQALIDEAKRRMAELHNPKAVKRFDQPTAMMVQAMKKKAERDAKHDRYLHAAAAATRSARASVGDNLMAEDDLEPERTRMHTTGAVTAAEEARARRGFASRAAVTAADQARKKAMKKLAYEARRGEGDKHVDDRMPKHLFSGKRGFKADYK